jgi:hypothetical protein
MEFILSYVSHVLNNLIGIRLFSVLNDTSLEVVFHPYLFLCQFFSNMPLHSTSKSLLNKFS